MLVNRGYLYMKYIELFIATVNKHLGFPHKEQAGAEDGGIVEMTQLLVQQIMDKGASKETSI